MSELIDISGQRFGRLMALYIDKSRHGKTYWVCQCDCGKQTSVYGSKLRTGETKSCGCLRKEITSKRRKRHGLTKKTLHNAWINMKTRCDNPIHNEYHRYGGRGITYCKEWNSFDNFMKWALSNGFKEEKDNHGRNLLSLDRIDNDKNYCPENCKWSTRIEQARNKYTNKNYKYKGNFYCLTALSEMSSVSIDTIRKRIKQGWSVEDAVDTPSKTLKKRNLRNGTK